MRARPLLACALAAACDPLPEEADFILIPAVVDASGEASTAGGGSVTVRTTIEWQNGEDAPETNVAIDGRVSVEDDETQDFLGRILLEPTSEFDNVLDPGESDEVAYEGTQSPPAPEVDLDSLCDGRSVHLQVQYSTHGSLVDAPASAVSNAFVFECD